MKNTYKNLTYLNCKFLIRLNISTCPAEYCSMTSLTSYGRKASRNLRLATKYLIFLMALMAALWVSVSWVTRGDRSGSSGSNRKHSQKWNSKYFVFKNVVNQYQPPSPLVVFRMTRQCVQAGVFKNFWSWNEAGNSLEWHACLLRNQHARNTCTWKFEMII